MAVHILVFKFLTSSSRLKDDLSRIRRSHALNNRVNDHSVEADMHLQ